MSLLADAGLVALLAGLALLAYGLKTLDARGALASFVLGAVVAFLGGASWLVVFVAFTGIGFAATRFQGAEKERRRVAEANDGERGIGNVMANGAAPALAAIAASFLDPDAAAVAFVAAVATHTADTVASEIGSLAPRVRRVLPPFAPGRAGDNGCVSLRGQVAAAVGATTIAVLAASLGVMPARYIVLAAAVGFLGCQLDSVLGDTLERDHLNGDRPLGKGDVNFVSAALPAFMVLVALLLL